MSANKTGGGNRVAGGPREERFKDRTSKLLSLGIEKQAEKNDSLCKILHHPML